MFTGDSNRTDGVCLKWMFTGKLNTTQISILFEVDVHREVEHNTDLDSV